MEKVISIVSGKGGTGKSTVAAFLGQAMAKQGLHVLLVEMDAGLRCLDILMAMEKTVVYDLSDLLEGRCSAMQATLLHPQLSNLRLICAPLAADYTPAPESFAEFIEAVCPHFDCLLLDTPAGIGPATRLATQLSDLALMVTTPDLIAVRDAAKTAALLARPGLGWRLLINRVTSPLPARPGLEDLDDVVDGTGIQLLGVLPHSQIIAQAGTLGEMLPEGSLVSRIFQRIGQRICGENSPLLYI